MQQFELFDTARKVGERSVVNVAAVPQRSPFRYPGGKTWLVPVIRMWLQNFNPMKTTLIEPFAGGGIVSLTAAFEKLAANIVMVELDDEVASVWETILGSENEWLADSILNFDLTLENVKQVFALSDKGVHDLAFATILKNRIFHGGIITKGSGILKKGENGKGIGSRWYPRTLYNRITAIQSIRNLVEFHKDDGFNIIRENLNHKHCAFFIDPPYTIAGKRLYTHFNINHGQLFELVAQMKGNYLMTYDDTEEVRKMADYHHLQYRSIPMKTTHHRKKYELLISNAFDWFI